MIIIVLLRYDIARDGMDTGRKGALLFTVLIASYVVHLCMCTCAPYCSASTPVPTSLSDLYCTSLL